VVEHTNFVELTAKAADTGFYDTSGIYLDLSVGINSRNNIELSRGSQFQNVPQLNFAQIDPVTVASTQNIMPS